MKHTTAFIIRCETEKHSTINQENNNIAAKKGKTRDSTDALFGGCVCARRRMRRGCAARDRKPATALETRTNTKNDSKILT